MTKHFERQIVKLNVAVLDLGKQVERTVEDAIEAIEQRNVDLARKVIDGDRRIDLREVDLEEECLQTLALHQPVAADLRFLISVVKINGELERIADLAVNLAERALHLETDPADLPLDLQDESLRVRTMVQESLKALVGGDVDLAEHVRQSDDVVDRIHREFYRQIKRRIQEVPAETGRLIDFLSISRQLERIADHAVNIAEDVIYMMTGEIRRHQPEMPTPATGKRRG